ncbi:MAG TPA: thiamine pyrophosphate-binding protein, partial [Burkholderiales bacterium]|nr:thiamine pyrophosphate-binding protein [Burkholderiales bacterium]
MARMSAGRALIESLRAEDVEYVFGIVGSCMVEFMDEFFDRKDIAWIGTRHEQGASHMADGYARISGKTGVCMATNGPGATNFATGVSVAKLCHAPMIAMTGASMLSQVHRESFQEIEQVAMFKPLTKWSAQVPRADRIPELMRHAFRVATTGKKGPVHIDLPRDLFNETIDAQMQPQAQYRDERAGAAHSDAIAAAVDALLKAKRPVIVAGLGVQDSGAQREVLELAEMLSAAIVTSYGRNDVIPTEHAHVLGAIGRAGAPEAKAMTRSADLVLAVGTRLGHFTTMYDNSNIPAGVPLLHIEVDPKEVGRNYPVAVGLVGDARETLRAIIAGLKSRETKWPRNKDNLAAIAKGKQDRATRLGGYARLDTPAIQPRRVHAELTKV